MRDGFDVKGRIVSPGPRFAGQSLRVRPPEAGLISRQQ
jgi:hypothetical protein